MNGNGGILFRLCARATLASPYNMRQLALRIRASSLLRKIRAFPYVLLVTVQTLFAESENCEVAADPVAGPNTYVRK